MGLRCKRCNQIARQKLIVLHATRDLTAFRCGCRLALVDGATRKVVAFQDVDPLEYIVIEFERVKIDSPGYGPLGVK